MVLHNIILIALFSFKSGLVLRKGFCTEHRTGNPVLSDCVHDAAIRRESTIWERLILCPGLSTMHRTRTI
ncbi:MAG: hypothetical protein C0600_11750 [Ignavibacteria bacterium]|nr:MAG: hypothetical protein C0600_11750 [Ignavibacteria bacterium]